MQNSRLFEVIQILDKRSITEIKKMLRSPFFNHQENLSLLFEWLVKQKKKNKSPDKTQAFRHIFKSKRFDDTKMRLMMSDLLKPIEKYMVIDETLSNNTKYKIDLARIYRKKHLSRHFKTTATQAEKQLNSNALEDVDFLKNQYHLEIEKFEFESSIGRTKAFNLQEISDVLDISFIAEKLRQSCTLLSHQAVFKTEYSLGLTQSILEHIRRHPPLLKYPAIALYYHGYSALKAPENQENFKAFQEQLFKHAEKFSIREQRELYLLGINYCIRMINGGQQQYFQEGFRFYQKGMTKEIFLIDGQMSRFTYSNITAFALQQSAYDWTEDFLQTYANKLSPKYRESTYDYNLARLEFARNNYSKVLALLQNVDYKDTLTNLSAKTMMMKIYYETDELDLLHAHLSAMKNFIRRKRVMGYHQENYNNIIQLTNKLAWVNHYDKDEIKQLTDIINDKKPLTERKWLLEKINTLR